MPADSNRVLISSFHGTATNVGTPGSSIANGAALKNDEDYAAIRQRAIGEPASKGLGELHKTKPDHPMFIPADRLAVYKKALDNDVPIHFISGEDPYFIKSVLIAQGMDEKKVFDLVKVTNPIPTGQPISTITAGITRQYNSGNLQVACLSSNDAMRGQMLQGVKDAGCRTTNETKDLYYHDSHKAVLPEQGKAVPPVEQGIVFSSMQDTAQTVQNFKSPMTVPSDPPPSYESIQASAGQIPSPEEAKKMDDVVVKASAEIKNSEDLKRLMPLAADLDKAHQVYADSPKEEADRQQLADTTNNVVQKAAKSQGLETGELDQKKSSGSSKGLLDLIIALLKMLLSSGNKAEAGDTNAASQTTEPTDNNQPAP